MDAFASSYRPDSSRGDAPPRAARPSSWWRSAAPWLCGLTLSLAACNGEPIPSFPSETPGGATDTPVPTSTQPPAATPSMPGATPTDPAAPTPTDRPQTPRPATPTPPPACNDRDADGYCGSADCNDASAQSHPGAAELCDGLDNDCDGAVDDVDADGDGWNDCLYDCDPTDAQVWPGNDERCDAKDNDCDDRTDEGFDGDSDGYSSCGSVQVDCDDAQASVHPGATETCNGRDDDCDVAADEGVGSTWYPDSDGDGYGSSAAPIQACSKPSGAVAQGGDCDDTSATTKPGAAELCDGKDNNCNGSVTDEGALKTFYADADADGYGSASSTAQACAAPPGYVSSSSDCDDTEATAHPGAAEACDGLDNDCDDAADEGLTGSIYIDADGDGYGDPDHPAASCAQCDGACVTDDTDCNDSDASVHPDAPELADGKDNDCDGEREEGVALGDVAAWFNGTSSGGGLGAKVAGVGDLDGDGFDDFAIAAPQGGANRAGAAYVVYGHSGSWGKVDDVVAGPILTVDETGSEFGASLTGGDIDNDGISDLMVGAPKYNSLNWEDAGIVFILYGGERLATQVLAATNPRTLFVAGYTPDVTMGSSLDATGDMNGDTIADLLIGAPWPWVSQIPPLGGITFILPGRVGKYPATGGLSTNQLVQVYGETNQVLGVTVRHVGDIDLDGYGDFVAVGRGKQGSLGSAYSDGGIAYAVGGDSPTAYTTGATSTLNVEDFALASWTGDTAGDMIGQWVAAPGDVDGDGRADFLLGRQVAKTGEPMAMLFLGSPLPPPGAAESNASVVIKSSAAGQVCPCAVGEVGDYDGDGRGDFAVAGLGAAGGKVYLFYGRPTWPKTLTAETDADLVFTPEASGDQAGISIAALGDINGDGNSDFAIGAAGVDTSAGSNAGRVYLFFGF